MERYRKGYLFGKTAVKVDPRAPTTGGSWQWWTPEGDPLVYDGGLVKLVHERIPRDSVMVDVGASTGSFCLLGALMPLAAVHAFEPVPEARDILESNIALNGLDVAIYPFALSNYDGPGTMHVPADKGWLAVATRGEPREAPGRPQEWREIEVEVRQLDGFCIPHVDFVKIDVEGEELHVLQGAEETVRRDMPSLLVEYQALNTRQFGYEPERILELLESWGYESFEHVGIEDLYVKRNHNDS